MSIIADKYIKRLQMIFKNIRTPYVLALFDCMNPVYFITIHIQLHRILSDLNDEYFNAHFAIKNTEVESKLTWT